MERYTETCPCCIDCVEKTNKHLLYGCPGSQQVWHAKDPSPQWSCVLSIKILEWDHIQIKKQTKIIYS